MNDYTPHALLLSLSTILSYALYGTKAGGRLRRSEVLRRACFGLEMALLLGFGSHYGRAATLGDWLLWAILVSIPPTIGAAWLDAPSANQEAVREYKLPESK